MSNKKITGWCSFYVVNFQKSLVLTWIYYGHSIDSDAAKHVTSGHTYYGHSIETDAAKRVKSGHTFTLLVIFNRYTSLSYNYTF